jgi:hypothetical protein
MRPSKHTFSALWVCDELFDIGSSPAGPKIAAILSVVESCRRLKLPVRDYLAAVLPGLADLPIQRLPGLTPAAWVAHRS